MPSPVKAGLARLNATEFFQAPGKGFLGSFFLRKSLKQTELPLFFAFIATLSNIKIRDYFYFAIFAIACYPDSIFN